MNSLFSMTIPAQEAVRKFANARRMRAASAPYVVRDAPSALLTMRYIVDGINVIHPEAPRAARPRRTHGVDPASLRLDYSLAGRDLSQPWAPAFAGVDFNKIMPYIRGPIEWAKSN